MISSHTHSFSGNPITRKSKNIVLIGNTLLHAFVYFSGFDRFTDRLTGYLIEVS